MSDLDAEWEAFLECGSLPEAEAEETSPSNVPDPAPEPSKLHVSAQSLLYKCNCPVDLGVFWKIPVGSYNAFKCSVVKKEMKLTSSGQTEYDNIVNVCNQHPDMTVSTIDHYEVDDKHGGPSTLMHARRVSKGLSRASILVPKKKLSRGFNNCFVLNVRAFVDGMFREFHVKIFNTGVIKAPGAQCPNAFSIVLAFVVQLLQTFIPGIEVGAASRAVVMSNSDFSCNYHLDRDALNRLLIRKYGLPSRFDACSNYMGVKSAISVDPATGLVVPPECHTSKCVSVTFMVFRTGSALIVGRCDIPVLNAVYKFVSELLQQNHAFIAAPYDTAATDKRRRVSPKTFKKRGIRVSTSLKN